MKQDIKQRRFPWGLIMLVAIAGSYIHGVRIADLSELPSSERPWKILVEGRL